MSGLKERFFQKNLLGVEHFERPPANEGEFRLVFYTVDNHGQWLRPPVFVDRGTRVESNTGESLRTLPFALAAIARRVNGLRIVEVDGWIGQNPPYRISQQWKQVALGDGIWSIYVSRIKLPDEKVIPSQQKLGRYCLED